VAKDLPSQMIHQGQGVLRHDHHPARDEKHVSEIKYSEPAPILTSRTHERVLEDIPRLFPHRSFSRESFYARNQLKRGIFLIESYMQLLSSVDPPCTVLNLKGTRASNPIYRTKSSHADLYNHCNSRGIGSVGGGDRELKLTNRICSRARSCG